MSWLRTKPQGEPIYLRHHLCIHVTLGFFRITGIPFRRPHHILTSTHLVIQSSALFHLVCHSGFFLCFSARRPGHETSWLLSLAI